MSFVDLSIGDYDLDMLEEYLALVDHPDEVMLLSALDGYLTAIALAPQLIRPGEWLPGIWGGLTPTFDEPDVANAVHAAIMGLYNDNLRSLAGPQVFEPIFDVELDGSVFADIWADGFMEGVRLRPDDWKPLLSDEEQSAFVGPMVALAPGVNGGYFIEMPKRDRRRISEKAPDVIPMCVMGIRSFWQERGLGPLAPPPTQVSSSRKSLWLAQRRSKPSIEPFAIPAKSAKVGRNAPCPCGSGKKYKRCCGA